MPNLPPVRERLAALYPDLPRGEQAVARILLDDHPMAALGSLRALAGRAGVSPPTATRLFARPELGGDGGFGAFREAVRAEVRGGGAAGRSRLRGYVDAVDADGGASVPIRDAARELRDGLAAALRATVGPQLARVGDLLATAPAVRALGGPIGGLAAEYLVRQLGSLRPGVARVPDGAGERARLLLDLAPRTAVVAYDFRRYSARTEAFAREARARGARLVLVTDAWRSPLAPDADLLLRLPRESAGPIAPLTHEVAVTELMLVAAVRGLPGAAERLGTLDELGGGGPATP
ncbi:hypothetical protein BIV57_22085 [Mangrovactinospora gilvigrisea]|uniref:SIS domain-containing protein n=1 Tax=Mangrovactinospora gilvigrisea TaxID=1428644 RepID=A0A1J7C192_9ACTN|nr:MurR/RpiR family transcriptional regulator [Mangrovactinospora gilvigrisea]OIV35340.1 hypothetical protein BIV57_22085 [Mangrovactinospora gilvigrisea]